MTETSRMGTPGSERISGSPTTTAARNGGAMAMVAVPAPAVTSKLPVKLQAGSTQNSLLVL